MPWISRRRGSGCSSPARDTGRRCSSSSGCRATTALLGWFHARPSGTDVASVARGIAKAVAVVVPGAGSRMLERLGITQDPEREAALLAEMLAEDLVDWPATGLLVIDDYHYVAESAASEQFVATLVERAPVLLLLASRVRPTWVETRSILSGAVLEIPQSTLAMSVDEADLVLDGARVETPGLVALTGGWPAVVGLAGDGAGCRRRRLGDAGLSLRAVRGRDLPRARSRSPHWPGDPGRHAPRRPRPRRGDLRRGAGGANLRRRPGARPDRRTRRPPRAPSARCRVLRQPRPDRRDA